MLVAVTGGPPEVRGRERRKKTFQWLGQAAKQYGVPLCVTTPDLWGRYANKQDGWHFTGDGDGAQFVRAVRPAPERVVWDAMYLDELEEHRENLVRLRRHLRRLKIPYFNPVLPGKDIVYKRMQSASLAYGQLPKTVHNASFHQVIEMLDQCPRVWYKPTLGSGGRNMLTVEQKNRGRYHVRAERLFGQKIDAKLNDVELSRLIRRIQQRRTYMLQEHIPMIHTPEGSKLDFRVSLYRGDSGRWRAIAVTGRYGRIGSDLTNFHAGGRVVSYTRPNLAQMRSLAELGILDSDLQQIQKFSVEVANHLAKSFPSLAILGLDIGLTEEGKRYVYDFNGRPGRDILTDQEIQSAMYSVAGYARYLLNRAQISGRL